MRFFKTCEKAGLFWRRYSKVAGPPTLIQDSVSMLTFRLPDAHRGAGVHFPRQGFGPNQEL